MQILKKFAQDLQWVIPFNWVFFRGCKFVRFASQICTCNFLWFYFLRFHTMAIRFSFFRWYEKTSCQPLTLHFLWACAFIVKSRSFSAVLNTSIHKSRNTCASRMFTCSCELKLISPGMTQAVGFHSSWFKLRKLGLCVFNHRIKRGGWYVT